MTPDAACCPWNWLCFVATKRSGHFVATSLSHVTWDFRSYKAIGLFRSYEMNRPAPPHAEAGHPRCRMLPLELVMSHVACDVLQAWPIVPWMPHAALGTGHVVNVAESAAPIVPWMPHAAIGARELVRRGLNNRPKKKPRLAAGLGGFSDQPQGQ